jgi:Ca-activated chloride channel homolog
MKPLKWQIHPACIALCFLALMHKGYAQESAIPEAGNIVQARVTVTDPLNRFVTGLQKTNFRIYENKTRRPVAYFAQAAPMSVAIVCDLRKDAEGIHRQASGTIRRLAESANPEDEFFLVSFNRSAAVVESINRLRSTIDIVRSFGQLARLTPLDQAIYVGFNRITKNSPKMLRALVVITISRELEIGMSYEVWNVIRQTDLQLHIIEEGNFPSSDIGNIRVYRVDDFKEVGYYVDLIFSELRSQYILGYVPLPKRNATREPVLSVEIESPPGLPKLNARVSKPYPAPKGR